MAILTLNIDVENRLLLASRTSREQGGFVPRLFSNDVIPVNLFFLNSQNGSSAQFAVNRYPSAGIRMGIISPLPATAGTYKITFGANTTAAIAFDATAAAVQTALQAIASIGSGNVSVTGTYLIGFVLEFTGALAGANQSAITATVTSIYPAAVASIKTIRNGTTGVNELQSLKITAQAATLTTSFTEITPADTMTITHVQSASGANQDVWSFVFDSRPCGGTWDLTLKLGSQVSIISNIPYNVSISALQALVDKSFPTAGLTIWTGTPGVSYFVMTLTGATPTTDLTDTVFAFGWTGTLDLSPQPIDALLGASDSVTTYLEIELTPSGGSAETVLHAPIKLYNDYIK